LKILYISTVFPSPEKNSTIYTDLIEELKERGHEIVVVATDDKRNVDRTKLNVERGVTVLRVKTGSIYDVSLIEKGISILTLKYYLISAIKKFLKHKKFDLILFESPPVTIVDVVNWAMKYFKCPSYLMLKDIFPQNAVDIGIMKTNSIVYRYFKQKEKKLYHIATTIGCMSNGNKEYILKHNLWLNRKKIDIFPNTKKINYYGSKPTDFKMRCKYGIPEDAVVAVYGGNMGKPQGLDFLLDIMSHSTERNDIFFLLVGRGTERSKIRDYIKREGLKNVLLIDNLPRDEYETLITECDIGLIFLDKRFTISNFPSRVLSYFEYSLPVLAATDVNTDFKEMIEKSKAGFWVQAGDIEDFMKKLDILIKDNDLRYRMGKSGREYLERNFHVGISADILERHFKKNNSLLD
jgi:glycosyltransferase involved in cell wall biosynthesis